MSLQFKTFKTFKTLNKHVPEATTYITGKEAAGSDWARVPSYRAIPAA